MEVETKDLSGRVYGNRAAAGAMMRCKFKRHCAGERAPLSAVTDNTGGLRAPEPTRQRASASVCVRLGGVI